MKRLFLTALLTSALSMAGAATAEEQAPVAIAIHGGAGTILKANLTPEQDQAYRDKLNEAVIAGYAVLKNGGSSTDAIIAAIEIMEASPLFNAGVGAVYTWEAEHELDASIMEGDTLNAGAVAGVKTIASPIAAARAVMDHSVHVMLSGEGAQAFAVEQGLAMVENSHFDTERRMRALEKVKARLLENDHASLIVDPATVDYKFGTVGAVALDANGNIAAGTSTGGMTAKRWGRVGDSPIIGAGTWADNSSCAVSATGHGEFFIRNHVAADICSRVKYQGVTIAEAGETVMQDVLLPMGGTGGVIIIDAEGNIAMPFNTEGMYRASVDVNGEVTVAIYKEN
ncbi:isoaspartyl peptidase/L-asparaginase [Alteromonas sp. KUL49]|uniref:isoaspartyl peptidase/L-asparaginase family protein n=1 Tax=Alteromonas sp. KUL49 TaxID=2480798 RepID=UPI00102F0E94|nr:isoaspartyl peptidase/L-asparaginase [Alteromonas sp. KUL49]TAP42317.1 isoaspartyl peptidase/L-asparaginase [Alteromonas sp. KUL49]GEA09924.1 isoaspartyl peptidase/L-asparaginase [Alteromonas sp. KUL49]